MKKEIISSGKMTFKFIWHYILYSLLLALITGFIYSLISSEINNVIIINIIRLVLSGISVFLATRLSLKDIFSANKLKEEDKKKYKRNIIIFFILIIIITTIYYALIHIINTIKIDTMVANITIADGQDITGVINTAKNIVLAIAGVSAVIESLIYIVMIKYQDKYIYEKTKKEDNKKGE